MGIEESGAEEISTLLSELQKLNADTTTIISHLSIIAFCLFVIIGIMLAKTVWGFLKDD